jgi:hypothetical protein
LSQAVSVVESCGDPEAELLLQQGITSLEDLSNCDPDLLTSLPGIDEAGGAAIRERAAELAVRKIEEEALRLEEARLEAERAAEEAAIAEAAAAEATIAEAAATEGVEAEASATEGVEAEAAKTQIGDAEKTPGADVASESPAVGDVDSTLSSTT